MAPADIDLYKDDLATPADQDLYAAIELFIRIASPPNGADQGELSARFQGDVERFIS